MASEGKEVSNCLQQPGQVIRPFIGLDEIPGLVRRIFGLTTTSVKELVSYNDKNFHIQVSDCTHNPHLNQRDILNGNGFVLKILNSLDSQNEEEVAAQNAMMLFLASKGIDTTCPIKNVEGSYMKLTEIPFQVKDSFIENNVCDGRMGSKHFVRLLTFVPGITQANVPHTAALAFQSGKLAAQIDNYLKDFHSEPLKQRNFIWSLDNISKLSSFVSALRDAGNRQLIHEILHAWDETVMPILPDLERGYIHGDCNDHNILVSPDLQNPTQYHISGILDLGDSHYASYVFELGITIMYQMLMARVEDSVDVGGYVVAGYSTQRKVTEKEWTVLKECVCARFAQSLVMGEYSYQQNPGNKYLLATAKQGWSILRSLWELPKEQIIDTWKAMVKEYQI